MGLRVNIDWAGSVRLESGILSGFSRYGLSPTPSGKIRLTDGTGASQANDAYEAAFALEASGGADTLLIDLKGGTGEVSLLNLALAFTKVKGVEVILAAPASNQSVRFGPDNATNAAQLWFPGVGAGVYQEVRSRFAQWDEVTGWALDATHKIAKLKNPNAVAVSGWIRVIGTR